MKKLIKIFLLSIVVFMSNISVQAQEKLPTLTQQQMQEDFNYFCKIIQDVNPQLTVRKKVTGVNILKNIQSLQSELDTITQIENFYLLIEKALNLCHDMHASITTASYETRKDIDKKIMALNELYYQTVEEMGLDASMPMSVLKYYKGGYYFYTPMENYYNNEKTQFNVGDRLLEIDGIPMDDYILKINQYRNNTTAWDHELKKFFSIRPSFPSNSFTVKNSDGQTKTIRKGGTSINSNQSRTVSSPQVIYFADTKILFIRVPAMDVDLIEYFDKEIPKVADNKEIAKVVIDVRANGGGNDSVWRSLLTKIIKEPVIIKQKLLVKNTPMVREHFKEILNRNIDQRPVVTIPFLDNETFIDFDDDPIVTLQPAENSIQYSGKIFVLFDERSYSSTLSLLEVVNQNPDRMASVGELGGNMGGQGGNPAMFVLPHSKITFRIDAMLDYYDVKNAGDFFHNKIMYPVKTTVQEYSDCMLTEEERYSKAFLYNKDPMFKRVLEIK